MPWSNQGGGGSGPQPSDIEGLLRKGQDRMKRFLPGGFGGVRGAALIISLAAAVWLGSGFYTVEPDEQGVELVFGEWISTTQPGLNYNLPAPIGQVYTPKVTRVNRVEIGYRSGSDSTRTTTQRQVPNEALMLTGDENIIDVNFVGLWIINEAGKFLFNIRSPEQTVGDAAESAMREVIGKTEAEYARAEGRRDVETRTQELLQAILDLYGTGILITQVQLQKVDPPEVVIDSFRDVQRARAGRGRAMSEADAYANTIIPRARGEAAQMVQEASAYKAEVVARALALGREEGRYESVVRVFMPVLKRIPPSAELVWFAPEAVRALLLRGDTLDAEAWFALMRASGLFNKDTAEATDRLRKIVRLMGSSEAA